MLLVSRGPVSWVYPPELYPLRVRGKAVALATSANWGKPTSPLPHPILLTPIFPAFNAALGAFVPPAFVNIRWKTYIVFGVFCLCMLIHTFFMFPETAGKTLEEVELMFEDPKGIRGIGTPAWKTRVEYRHAVALERGEVSGRKGSVLSGEESERVEDVRETVTKQEV